MELGRVVQSCCEGKGNEACGGFGDRNSKLSVDFRGDLGEDMTAAQFGDAWVTEAWGKQGALAYRMAGSRGCCFSGRAWIVEGRGRRGYHVSVVNNATRLDGARVSTCSSAVVTAHGPPGGFGIATGVHLIRTMTSQHVSDPLAAQPQRCIGVTVLYRKKLLDS